MYNGRVLGTTGGVLGTAALARTGFDVAFLGLLAILLVVGGLALLRWATVRRSATSVA